MENILVIIPVLNEEETIAGVIQGLQQQGLTTICVVDNGSNDRTPSIAAQAGAQVISEPRRGYGQACWSGLQSPAAAQAEWILFCDGDGSDDLSQLPELIVLTDNHDLILGNRRGSVAGRAQLTPAQNFGNWLATWLIHLGWGYAYHDLGPLRLIRKASLDQLAMADRGFGWTVEMQAKAVSNKLRICERPVNYLPRQGGRSKISGTLRGSFKAGQIILTTLAQLYWEKTGGMLLNRLSTIGQTKVIQTTLLWLSALSLIVGGLWAMPHGDFLNQPDAVPIFWRGIGLMSTGFIASWGLKKITGSWFWGVAIAPRLIMLAMHPGDDIWRYLWEGHIQIEGFNPYLLAPTTDVLEPLRFSWWEFINHPDHAAIYPPVTQLGFRFLAALNPSVLLFKLAFTIADLGICGLLCRRFGYRATLLYAWNPLVIYSFAGGGHYDSWFLLPLVAAWLWWDTPDTSSPATSSPEKFETTDKRVEWHRRILSAIAIGLSIAVKWMSLPVLLFIAWRQQRSVSQSKNNLTTTPSAQMAVQMAVLGAIGLVVLGLLPIALSALPFCQGLSCPILPLSSSFVSYGRSASLVPHFVALLWPASIKANWIYAMPLGLALLWNLVRVQRVGTFIERYFIVLMLLSPIIHAWYFTWLAPFAVASRNWGTRLVCVSSFVYFALPYGLALGGESWTLSPLQYWALWAPLLLGLAVQPILGKSPTAQSSQTFHQN
ncbi:MAG: glycosyltransferase family 2 protein [Cyanobacteria bacterium P01_F01_bin.53]